MSQHRLSRRHALKVLSYGALLTLSACGKRPIPRVTETSEARYSPSRTPPPTVAPTTTNTPEPSATPEPSSTPKPSNVPEPTSPAQETSLPQPSLRPVRVMGLHVPYTFLERRIDFAALEAVMVGTGANCAVIDIKAEGGKIAVPFEHPLKPSYTNNAGFNYAQVGRLVSWLLEHHYYPVARQVVMTDTPLAATHDELAYHFYSPEPYVDVSGELWLDPERLEVGGYNAAIAVATAQMGFREVQLDYIRYPEADFDKPIERRVEAIAAIVATIQSALNGQALLTIDVLGDSTRNYPDSIADGGYGQHIPTLAQIVDGVCPMLYPNLRHENIDVDYYQTVHTGTARASEKVASGGSKAFVNPWIQAYYPAGLSRIRQQTDGAFQADAAGVFAWNNSLHYPDGMYGLNP